MAAIYTMDGDELTDGLQGCSVCDEAIEAACRTADRLGADVHLSDDDGDWIVHPVAADGSREAADPIDSDEDGSDDADDDDALDARRCDQGTV